jgi:hypothetical protein
MLCFKPIAPLGHLCFVLNPSLRSGIPEWDYWRDPGSRPAENAARRENFGSKTTMPTPICFLNPRELKTGMLNPKAFRNVFIRDDLKNKCPFRKGTGAQRFAVTPEGFEPPTNRTGICHSIQLNYGAVNSGTKIVTDSGFQEANTINSRKQSLLAVTND